MTTFDPVALLEAARARQRNATARAEAALARLGGGSSRRSSSYLTDGLTAEEIERDTRAIRRILAVWKRIGHPGGSQINLPSGKVIGPKARSDSLPAKREYAVVRNPRRRGVTM